jgi:hypothetical protein
MTLNEFSVGLAQLSGSLFIVASMLAMGMSLTKAQLLFEQPESKHLIPPHSRVPRYNS